MLNLNTSALQRSRLDPNWITGFIDAEGCFTTTIFRNDLCIKSEWRVTPSFQLELHVKDLDLLLEIKSYFNDVGTINIRSTRDSANYQIRDLRSIIDIVIPHFDKYPLMTQKYSDYLLFKKIIKLLENKEHLIEKGLTDILSLKASLNKGISKELQLIFPEIYRVSRERVSLPDSIDYGWLAGFFSGDGCFFVNTPKARDCTLGYSVKLSLSLTQHVRDKVLLDKIVEILKCGVVYRHGKDSVVLKVATLKEIYNIFIPIFEKYPIKGIKLLDFKDFCTIALMVRNKIHLTWEGLEEIRKIKYGMNKGRKWK